MRRYLFRALALLVLFASPVAHSQGTPDYKTQRNGMHSCPVGQVVTGIQAAKNILICAPAPAGAEFGAEKVDNGTQADNMHACPVGSLMTGLQTEKNKIACVPSPSNPTQRYLDVGTQQSFGGVSVHACQLSGIVVGVEVAKNELLCVGKTNSPETADTETQRNSMHSCPTGMYVTGVQANKNQFLCNPGPVDNSQEQVDTATQSHGMHACPEKWVMTGVNIGANKIACAPLNAPLIPRLVDRSTQRQLMHACPIGLPISGIQNAENLLLCGDEYVLRVSDFTCSSDGTTMSTTWQEPAANIQIKYNDPLTVHWDVVCTAPGCATGTTLQGSVVMPNGSQTVSQVKNDVVYTLVASSAGGVDSRSCSVSLTNQTYTFQVLNPDPSNYYCAIVTEQSSNEPSAAAQAQKTCTNCAVTLVPNGTTQCNAQ